MSFPSAIMQIQQGATSEEALFYAMQHDTTLGFTAISAITEAIQTDADPIEHTRERLRAVGGEEAASAVLRGFRRGNCMKVDFDPDSTVGRQTARLMTDAARDLLSSKLGMQFGFANCCGILASPNQTDVRFTIGEQIEWQHSIDC